MREIVDDCVDNNDEVDNDRDIAIYNIKRAIIEKALLTVFQVCFYLTCESVQLSN